MENNTPQADPVVKERQDEQEIKEKRIFKAALIDANRILESQARDVADARMTESKEGRSKNRISKFFTRMWKHNLAQEWYRQREISRTKKEILKEGNIYAGEKEFDKNNAIDTKQASQEAVDAIVERFTSEFKDEMLREQEKESVEKNKGISKVAGDEIKKLISQYVEKGMPDEAFQEQKKRILGKYDKEVLNDKNLYIDNVLDIAKEVRDAIANGEKLTELDYDVELILGKAQESLRTEAQFSKFDSIVEKMQNGKVGKYIANQGAVMSILAGSYIALEKAGVSALRSKAVQWGSFGAGSVLSGWIAAKKDSARFSRERAQHMRERAKGVEFKEEDMKRRKEMEKFTYETRGAKDILPKLETGLAKIQSGNFEQGDIDQIMTELVDVESRIKLGDQKSIDLIAHENFSTVEKDRKDIDLLRARLKVALRKGVENKTITAFNNGSFDDYLKSQVTTSVQAKLGGELGIEKRDKTFKNEKSKRFWNKWWQSALVAATVGVVAQEITAFATGQDGIIEGAVKNLKEHLPEGGVKDFLERNTGDFSKDATALEAFRRHFTGDAPHVPFGEGHDFVIGDNHIKLPDDVTLVQHGATYDLVKGDTVLSKDIYFGFEADGTLSDKTVEMLRENGIVFDYAPIASHVEEHIQSPADEYLKNHPEGTTQIHRTGWYDNDTPMHTDPATGKLLGSDLNELRADWGGVGNTGMTENGDFVMTMARMTKDGSFHDSLSVDAKQALAEGKLKMLFSLSQSSQHQVFEVSVNPDGSILIPKDSEVAKLMFENHDGHALFTGRFAEVAQVTGKAQDGFENFNILATHEGLGKDMIDDTIIKDSVTNEAVLRSVPEPWDYSVPIPLWGARRPLERGEYKKFDKTERKIEEKPTNPNAEKIPPVPPTEEENLEKIEQKEKEPTDYISAVMTSNPVGLQNDFSLEVFAKKYKHPEFYIFESDPSNRENMMIQIEHMRKVYPNAKFTYVPLPDDMTAVTQNGPFGYMKNALLENAKKNGIDPNMIRLQGKRTFDKDDIEKVTTFRESLKNQNTTKIESLADLEKRFQEIETAGNLYLDKNGNVISEASVFELRDQIEKLKKEEAEKTKEPPTPPEAQVPPIVDNNEEDQSTSENASSNEVNEVKKEFDKLSESEIVNFMNSLPRVSNPAKIPANIIDPKILKPKTITSLKPGDKIYAFYDRYRTAEVLPKSKNQNNTDQLLVRFDDNGDERAPAILMDIYLLEDIKKVYEKK